VVNPLKIFLNPLHQHQGIFYFRMLTVAGFLVLYAASLAQPQLIVTDAKKNFGFVKRGVLVKNEFEITNTGNQPLIISAADVECSCTTVDFPATPILPGQKVKVVANFNTASVYGRQDRIVTLRSNDPKGETKLRFKGIVSNK
jgi:hypothetical protein